MAIRVAFNGRAAGLKLPNGDRDGQRPTEAATSRAPATPTASTKTAEASRRRLSSGSKWWERYPERLERELQALDAAGLSYERVQEDFDRGILTLRVTVDVDGKRQEVLATFPDLYPHFRFQVRAPQLDLPHHQNVFSKTLCLIGRSTANWLIDDNVAEFLTDHLSRVVSAARGAPGDASSLEEHQGEPISNYFPYWPAMCLVDSEWKIPTELQQGSLEIGIIDISVPVQGKPPALTAAVLEVLDDKGEIVCRAEPEITEAFQGRKMRGRWSRWLDPREGAAEDEHQHARNVWKALSNRDHRNWDQKPHRETDSAGNEAKFAVRGLLIEEEVGYQKTGPGWVFVVRVTIEFSVPPRQRIKNRSSAVEHHYFARAGRAGEHDLWARAEELAQLRNKRIAQVGLGCLGGISAVEFARAGLHRIRAIDHDIVEPGTVLRWPLGLGVAGRFKAEALRKHLGQHYPGTIFEARVRPLGIVRQSNDELSDEEVLGWLLDEADLVYDASAEIGVQWALAAYGRQRRVPYVRLAGTAGGWGGYVLRIHPERTPGCYWCFHEATMEGSFLAPERKDGLISPVGCADPTYIGAGFELAQIALQGVRVTVGTLCEGAVGGFPTPHWDVAVIRLRGAQGEFATPQVTTSILERRAGCAVCGVDE